MADNYQNICSIKPFICSTDDFQNERLMLKRNIVPILQSLCSQRGGSFIPYEWDHNLSEETLNQGQALRLAFDCLNSANPFFICFIGDTYGDYHSDTIPLENTSNGKNSWIDKNKASAAESGYKWLLDDTYGATSLYELKLIQISCICEQTQFCRFYIRESKVTHNQDSTEKFKLQQLKSSIAAKGFNVLYYETLGSLASNMLIEWTSIIDQVFPPFTRSPWDYSMQLIIDHNYHQLHGETKRERFAHYEGTMACFQKLTEFVSDENSYKYNPFIRTKSFEKPCGVELLKKGHHNRKDLLLSGDSQFKSICVLTGPRGCGKTALVSQWFHENRKFLPRNIKVIHHYASVDRFSRNIAVFMMKCITELRQHFLNERFYLDEDIVSFSQLQETFLAALNYGPCFIIFDGIDEISDSMGKPITELKKMQWLPEPLPPTCKILFTVTLSDLSNKGFQRRKDTVFVSCPILYTAESKQVVLHQHLNQSGVMLSSHQLNQIVNYKLSSTPLYLYTLAHELQDFNLRRDIQTHLNVYANTDGVYSSTRDMWTSVVKRWVRDYSWTRDREVPYKCNTGDLTSNEENHGWIPDALRLILCSRNGLYAQEIIGILKTELGYVGKNMVTEFDWTLFYQAAKAAFTEKPNGLISVKHEHYEEVIDYLLLGNLNPLGGYEIHPIIKGNKISGFRRKNYHSSLLSYLISQPPATQLNRIFEILWQAELANDYQRLHNIVMLPEVIEKMFGNPYCLYNPAQIELVQFLNLLKAKQFDLQTGLMAYQDKLKFGSAGEIEVNPEICWTIKQKPTETEALTITKVERPQMDKNSENLSVNPTSVINGSHLIDTSQQISESDESKTITTDVPQDEQSSVILIPVCMTLAAQYSLVLAKYFKHLGYSSIDKILEMAKSWLLKKHQPKNKDLFVLANIFDELATLNLEEGFCTKSIELKKRAHECLLDILEDEYFDQSLLTFVKGKWNAEISQMYAAVGNLDLAGLHVLESRIAMSEIKCTPGLYCCIYLDSVIRMKKGDHKVAAEDLKSCLEYFELLMGAMNKKVADISHDLGILYASSISSYRNKAKAAKYLHKALTIRRVNDDKSLDLSNSMFALACIAQNDESKIKQKESVELLKDCLDIRVKKLGIDHEFTRTVLLILNELQASLHLSKVEVENKQFICPVQKQGTAQTGLMLDRRSNWINQLPSPCRPFSAYHHQNSTTKHDYGRPKTAPEKLNWDLPANRPFSSSSLSRRQVPTTAVQKVLERPPFVEAESGPNNREKTMEISKLNEKHGISLERKKMSTEKTKREMEITKTYMRNDHLQRNLTSVTLGPLSTLSSIIEPRRPILSQKPDNFSTNYFQQNTVKSLNKTQFALKIYAFRRRKLRSQVNQ